MLALVATASIGAGVYAAFELRGRGAAIDSSEAMTVEAIAPSAREIAKRGQSGAPRPDQGKLNRASAASEAPTPAIAEKAPNPGAEELRSDGHTASADHGLPSAPATALNTELEKEDFEPPSVSAEPPTPTDAPFAPSPVTLAVEPTQEPVVVHSGTVLAVRPDQQIGSNLSEPGDRFRGRLADAVPFQSGAIPAGSAVIGTVIDARPSGRVKGLAQISIALQEIAFYGEWHALRTNTVKIEAETTHGQDAKKVGLGAGVGSLVGGILGGKRGAAKGAVIGGAAGGVGVLATKGREVELSVESLVYFELQENLELTIAPASP